MAYARRYRTIAPQRRCRRRRSELIACAMERTVLKRAPSTCLRSASRPSSTRAQSDDLQTDLICFG
jgi:hypothetical protein